MSMLAGVARAGPSYPIFQQNVLRSGATLVSPGFQQKRNMAKVVKATEKQRSAGFSRKPVKRDARGEIIEEKKEKSLGAFRPLSVANLVDETFESEKRSVLNLPAFAPTQSMIGKATEFPILENDPARIYGLPKKMLLEFRILSKPCSVIRSVTVKSVELLNKAKDTSSLDTRFVLTGRAGCGKSFLMLQLVEHSIMNDWIVLYIPRAKKLVDSTTPHEYDLRTRTYFQPAFSFQTLQRLQAANHSKLSALTTQKKHVFQKREVPLGTNLTDLIGVALKDPPLAPLILEAVMSELSTQTKSPVLFAVDDFQALYCRTAYRDPHFVAIRPYHLSVPRLIMDFASGKRAFAKGAFVGAITSSDTVYKLPLELRDALGLPHERFPTPYDKRSRALVEYTTGLKALHVPEQLSVTEAASLFEVWKDDKALVSTMHDEVFLSKYTESSGNARDFVWKGLLSTLET
ncbi:hypothetical protein D9615_002174 [Tricholomella constricta]|uniref:Small ribosomal subunit protein mS29 n=1 Tax=Tricholomella constricta TaxID=117010 RepID=A0A8H5M9S7_9AGAR|nr:hypothetical protein D9615_002174 [Tricholomella constricta]